MKSTIEIYFDTNDNPTNSGGKDFLINIMTLISERFDTALIHRDQYGIVTNDITCINDIKTFHDHINDAINDLATLDDPTLEYFYITPDWRDDVRSAADGVYCCRHGKNDSIISVRQSDVHEFERAVGNMYDRNDPEFGEVIRLEVNTFATV